MKKSLSIFITSLSGGGAERVVSILLKELKNDFNITLVLMNDTIVYDIPKDIRVVYLENTNQKQNGIVKILKLPYLGYRYKNICQKNHIDISLSFMYRPNFINIFAKLFGLKSKVVISERNTPSKVYIGNSLASRVGNFLIKNLYSKADKIIPNSNGNSFDLIKNYGIEKEKLTVIENPFDIKKIEKNASEDIKVNKNSNFVFIMVGRLEVHKRHSLVIEAFSRLQDSNSELWILGQGPMESKLISLINDLELKERVKLLGFDKNPYKYMAQADCFILSSTREGFPNVLVEALACGLPVISSDCHSGPREILAPNSSVSKKIKNEIELSKYGILFPVDKVDYLYTAMIKMIEDKEIYDNYKKIVKSRASEFSLNKIIDQYKKVLEID